MKKKQKILLLLLLITFGKNALFAQEEKNDLPITISYFGETVTHPGINLGTELAIKNNWMLSLSVGTYLHYRHHRGVFVNASFNWRKTWQTGYSMDYGIGLGYLHTWQHGGKTYTVDAAGNFKEQNNWGHPALMPTLKLGILAYDFRQKKEKPIRLFSEVILFGQYPHNHFIMPHLALNVGGTYYLEK